MLVVLIESTSSARLIERGTFGRLLACGREAGAIQTRHGPVELHAAPALLRKVSAKALVVEAERFGHVLLRSTGSWMSGWMGSLSRRRNVYFCGGARGFLDGASLRTYRQRWRLDRFLSGVDIKRGDSYVENRAKNTPRGFRLTSQIRSRGKCHVSKERHAYKGDLHSRSCSSFQSRTNRQLMCCV